jgi:transposase-like protein
LPAQQRLSFINLKFKREDLQPLANVRIRGKIPREEWPKIAARFNGGETLTEIARSYGCTAPAIRYIVSRTPARGAKGKSVVADKPEKVSVFVPSSETRRTAQANALYSLDTSRGRVGASPASSETRDIWGRVNTDIATFLAAMDSLVSDDSDANYEAVLAATDRLLWASARTRLEVERILGSRRKQAGMRRVSG